MSGLKHRRRVSKPTEQVHESATKLTAANVRDGVVGGILLSLTMHGLMAGGL